MVAARSLALMLLWPRGGSVVEPAKPFGRADESGNPSGHGVTKSASLPLAAAWAVCSQLVQRQQELWQPLG